MFDSPTIADIIYSFIIKYSLTSKRLNLKWIIDILISIIIIFNKINILYRKIAKLNLQLNKRIYNKINKKIYDIMYADIMYALQIYKYMQAIIMNFKIIRNIAQKFFTALKIFMHNYNTIFCV